jgi:uncharacterized protein with von Willebrand factor type A (vWA) domain
VIPTDARNDLIATTVRFCRALRARGLPVTPAESIDATAALDHIDICDASELQRALRIVLTSRVEELGVFDEVFAEIWKGAAGAKGAGRAKSAEAKPHTLGPFSALSAPGALSAFRLPTPHESLTRRDVSTLSASELDEITRLASRLARRLVARRSRRWRAAPRGARVDPRRTLRRSLSTGGELAELARRERKIRKTSLVVVCDVSGSMDVYAQFLLQFVYALQNTFARVESFLFATRLSRITRHLHRKQYQRAIATLAADVRDWSGGTRIGESLEALEHQWSHLIDRHSILVMMSDGWETGDPARLGAVLQRLRKRAGKVIWLNPLLASPTYRPETRGMRAALPHIDVFAPLYNLESLRVLVRHLRLDRGRLIPMAS